MVRYVLENQGNYDKPETLKALEVKTQQEIENLEPGSKTASTSGLYKMR